jgi:hypothetical protein
MQKHWFIPMFFILQTTSYLLQQDYESGTTMAFKRQI